MTYIADQAVNNLIQDAVLAERERCADTVEAWTDGTPNWLKCAEAIRKGE